MRELRRRGVRPENIDVEQSGTVLEGCTTDCAGPQPLEGVEVEGDGGSFHALRQRGEGRGSMDLGLGRRRVTDEQPTVLVVSTNTKWGPHQPARVQLPEGMDH